MLREYVPLKQGLRLWGITWSSATRPPPRVCSTKTRIKTKVHPTIINTDITPRVCSTKTRIKTLWRCLRVLIRCPPRVCSTKTRIKTFYHEIIHTNRNPPRVCSTKTVLLFLFVYWFGIYVFAFSVAHWGACASLDYGYERFCLSFADLFVGLLALMAFWGRDLRSWWMAGSLSFWGIPYIYIVCLVYRRQSIWRIHRERWLVASG